MSEVGTYTLPVILSFDGVDKQVNGKLGKIFDGVGKKASKQLGDGAKAAAADVDKLAASYSKLKDKAADALGKVRTDEAALKKLRDSGASDDRIIRAEERLATSRRNSSRANREAEDSNKSLLDAQRSLGDGTDNLGRKFGGMSDLAGTAGKAIAGAGVVAAGAAVVGITALAAGVLVAGNALYDLGAEFDDVFDNIRVKTGATGPQLEALEKATKRLASGVPLSIGEIGNVVAETSRALHLTGTDLDNTSRAIANLGRLTGENVDVRELGKAFRGFGVDAKSQVPALDSIFRATQTTGVGVNELLATVVKSGAGLRAFGFDFGQSAALATQFESTGLDSTKALAGMTKGLATLAKDGKTGQDALKGTVGEIKNLLAAGNEAGALDLTNKLFGAKGGVQFFEAIKNGALDLDALTDSMSNTGDTIAVAASDTDDWAEKWQILQNKLKVGLEPIGTGVFNAVNDKLTQLGDWVNGHQDEVIRFFGRVGDAAINGLSGVLTFGSEALRGMGEMLRGFKDSMKPMLDAMANIGSVLQYVPGFQSIGQSMKVMGEGGQAMFDGLDKVPGFLDSAASKLDSLNSKLPGLKSKWNSIIERTAEANELTQALGDNVTAVVNGGGEIVLSSNTPEVADALDALGITITTLPGGEIGVTANTDEGQRIIDAWRDQQTDAPLELSTTVDPSGAQTVIENLRRQIAGQPPVGVPVSVNPNVNSILLPVPPRATGGIYDVWDSVASFANGKLPNQALIQSPVAGAGLVQWAEPATAGEAFIPLAQSKRSRSRAIWAETGRRLGMSFEDGGVLYDGIHGPEDRLPNENTIDRKNRQRKWWKEHPEAYAAWKANNDKQTAETRSGQSVWERLRESIGFENGGIRGIDALYAEAQSLVGTKYSMPAGDDCSGTMSQLVNAALGLPPKGDRMSTMTASKWLANKGALPGLGPNGTFRMGWKNGGPGGGHMAGTLPDGTNVEMGGANGGYTLGGNAKGADDPTFTNQAYLPFEALYPDGYAAGTGSSMFSSSGSSGGGGTPGIGPNGESGTYSAPDAKSVREAEQKVADADWKVKQAELKLTELDADAKESQKQSALKDVDDAKREAADARADAAETKRGKFTEGKPGKSGGPKMSELGSIAKSFFTETFGLDGSWFPDIGNLAPLKMADTLLGAFMPAGGGDGATGGATTSSAPFGIPDVALPPPGTPASGIGLGPAPGTTINVDGSTTIAGNVGWDRAELDRDRDRNLHRAVAKVPVGS